MDDTTLSIVLFSGTDDKLQAATVLIAGAAAMQRPVNVLLQYWAVDAFKADAVRKDHGASPEAGVEGAALLRKAAERGPHWSETLAQAKDLGDVGIHACALTTDLFGLTMDDLDPLVDDIRGVASFMAEANGPVVFI